MSITRFYAHETESQIVRLIKKYTLDFVRNYCTKPRFCAATRCGHPQHNYSRNKQRVAKTTYLHSTRGHVYSDGCLEIFLHFTFYILHFTLYTLHFTLYTLHFTLYTLHFTLYILHFTFYILHFKTSLLLLFVCFWRDSPQWARASSFTKLLDHTKQCTTVSRTPLDE